MARTRTYKITVADNLCFRRLFSTLRDNRRTVRPIMDYFFPGERVEGMIEMRRDGATLQKIADKYSVSRQRIDQILKPYGI